MSNKLNTLIIQFSEELDRSEIKYFRGAIISSIGDSMSNLFHNHVGDNFRYSYPLVQYKMVRKRAAIVCIKNGVEAIGEFFANADLNMSLGNREVRMTIDTVRPYSTIVQLWNDMFKYRVRNWLPLNSKNYSEFIKLDSLRDRVTFLERMLVGNLLSFAKGVGVLLEDELKCEIINLSEPRLVRNKNVKLMSFDIEFKTNMSLPEYVGIGKNASVGYGIVTQVKY